MARTPRAPKSSPASRGEDLVYATGHQIQVLANMLTGSRVEGRALSEATSKHAKEIVKGVYPSLRQQQNHLLRWEVEFWDTAGRKHATPPEADLWPLMDQLHDDPAQQVELAEQYEVIRRVILRLLPLERSAVYLHDWTGRTDEEVAFILGMTQLRCRANAVLDKQLGVTRKVCEGRRRP